MIDENLLIKEIHKQFPEWQWSPVGNIVKSVIAKIEMIIKAQPKVGDCSDCSRRKWYQIGFKDGMNKEKWIPCSEELPKESLDSVIGWDEYRKRCVFVQYYGGRWILGDNESVKIIAWQPQPEEPEMKKER